MITNSMNLPQPFVDAATSDHTYKPNRYSVTELLGGTCEAVLKRRHAGEGDEDVADLVGMYYNFCRQLRCLQYNIA